MSRASKPLTISRLNDVILGCFCHVKPSETVDHLVRYLGTWSGSDKLFMLIQYTLKLVAPFLRLRARLQHQAGLRQNPTSTTAAGYDKLAGIIGDSRTLWRMWGLLPIFQWLISLERSPPATRTLLTIERLQGWSMLAYYPLEHLYYLVSHGIIPSTITSPLSLFSSKPKKIKLDAGKLSLWSTRFWAVYVFLHFAHLIEDRKLLIQRQRALRKSKANGLSAEEKKDIRNRWDAFWSEVVINLGYLPLTIHWSLEKGLFKNDLWVTTFGLIAAVASFRSGWRATALPPPPPPPANEEKDQDAAN
ncbi:hypothetical protein CC1G_11632 [Coprinopsis cinerea okayama7|uniref:Uncharacterized protein n=1 Tax=Coprinopsis cinerea (strain Okayama-7 / 130 / ATCC MYA-4618 / FGSC 9003) TaxID=240176 RepID=A8P466_COPC7|nr:hypothetical protein CC1G_11632 [Coprinopsis cinerea okayama7\|eukprot:XP_001838689.1 hypothetical protein CC1G_11632 [Coprinopsis cinerea okayama7\